MTFPEVTAALSVFLLFVSLYFLHETAIHIFDVEEERDALKAAGQAVIRAANADPDDGPTGFTEALSALSDLVFPLEEEHVD